MLCYTFENNSKCHVNHTIQYFMARKGDYVGVAKERMCPNSETYVVHKAVTGRHKKKTLKSFSGTFQPLIFVNNSILFT